MDTPCFFLKNAYVIPVVPRGKVFKNGALLVENDTVVAVGDEAEVKKHTAGHDIVDCKRGIVLPGFVNSHTHLPETLIRGVCDDEKLEQWLFDHVWVMEQRMGPKEAEAGAMLGCLELIKNGVTAFIDQYFYSEEIASSVIRSGIRGLICPSIFDNCPESGSIENSKRKAFEFVKRWKPSGAGKVNVGLGPHAPYTVPKDILVEVAEFAAEHGVPLHIHMQETEWEMEKAKKDWGTTPFQYIDKLGVTRARLLAAHCVVTTKEDRQIMKKYDVSVLHNPASNLKLASGIAPVKEYLDTGINVGIGTDGSASNNNLVMLEEASLAAMLQKYITNDPRSITREEALEMITLNGAKAFGQPDLFGSLEKGKQADLVIISRDAPHMVPSHSPLSNILYSSNSADIRSVMVAGRFLMEDRKVTTMNEEEVIRKGIEAAMVIAGEGIVEDDR